MSSPIVVIEKDLLRSPAFRSLPSTAVVVLMDFMMKRKIAKQSDTRGGKRTVVTNNGLIEYSFAEATSKGLTRPAFCRARDVLVERGFIDVAHSGSGGRKGDKTLYAISDRWRSWGGAGFVQKTRTTDKRRGVGFAQYHQTIRALAWLLFIENHFAPRSEKSNIGNAGVT